MPPLAKSVWLMVLGMSAISLAAGFLPAAVEGNGVAAAAGSGLALLGLSLIMAGLHRVGAFQEAKE